MPKPPNNIITIYGRKPVLEALNQADLEIFRVHLADSNKPSAIIRDIEAWCKKRKIECQYHDRLALSRISKNKKQDQGVAADIINRQAKSFDDYLDSCPPDSTLIALDRITNPQNLGMIIRTVAASPMDGLLIPQSGCAKLDALVVKASAGSVFKSRLLFCGELSEAINRAKSKGFTIYGMALRGGQVLTQVNMQVPYMVVLGNETNGLSDDICRICDKLIYLPMSNGVESLNVGIAAGIVAFKDVLSS